MLSFNSVKQQMEKIWEKFLKENPKCYYCAYYYGEVSNNNFAMIIFKIPTIEEMCLKIELKREIKNIDGNKIYIFDIREIFNVIESSLNFYNPIYQKINSKENLIAVVKSFNENENETLIDIYDHLTPKEKIGLKAIYNKIGSEGYITISNLIQESKVSRIVFNNLFSMLEKYNSALIVNKGMKGTYVKITNPALINYLKQEK